MIYITGLSLKIIIIFFNELISESDWSSVGQRWPVDHCLNNPGIPEVFR